MFSAITVIDFLAERKVGTLLLQAGAAMFMLRNYGMALSPKTLQSTVKPSVSKAPIECAECTQCKRL